MSQGFRFDERRELLSLMLNSDNPTVQDALENALTIGHLALGEELAKVREIRQKEYDDILAYQSIAQSTYQNYSQYQSQYHQANYQGTNLTIQPAPHGFHGLMGTFKSIFGL
jgi:hypothetical protein